MKNRFEHGRMMYRDRLPEERLNSYINRSHQDPSLNTDSLLDGALSSDPLYQVSPLFADNVLAQIPQARRVFPWFEAIALPGIACILFSGLIYLLMGRTTFLAGVITDLTTLLISIPLSESLHVLIIASLVVALLLILEKSFLEKVHSYPPVQD